MTYIQAQAAAIQQQANKPLKTTERWNIFTFLNHNMNNLFVHTSLRNTSGLKF